MRVRVYRNLKHGRKAPPLYSIMSLETGRIIDRRPDVLLRRARFIVREAGRQRVITEGRKNVHAFVEGELESLPCPGLLVNGAHMPVKVSYNPYTADHFQAHVPGQEHPLRVTEASIVLLNEHGMTADFRTKQEKTV